MWGEEGINLYRKFAETPSLGYIYDVLVIIILILKNRELTILATPGLQINN